MERSEIENLRLEIQGNVRSFGVGVVTGSLSPAHVGYLTMAVRADVPARVHPDAPRLTDTGWQCVIDGPVYATEAEALIQTLLNPPVNRTPEFPFTEPEEYRPWDMTEEEISLSYALCAIDEIYNHLACGAVGFVESVNDSAIITGIGAEGDTYSLTFTDPFEGNYVASYDAGEFIPAAIAQNLGAILGYIESVSDGGENFGIHINPFSQSYTCAVYVLGAMVVGLGDTVTIAAARCAIEVHKAIREAERWQAAQQWTDEEIRAAAFTAKCDGSEVVHEFSTQERLFVPRSQSRVIGIAKRDIPANSLVIADDIEPGGVA